MGTTRIETIDDHQYRVTRDGEGKIILQEGADVLPPPTRPTDIQKIIDSTGILPLKDQHDLLRYIAGRLK